MPPVWNEYLAEDRAALRETGSAQRLPETQVIARVPYILRYVMCVKCEQTFVSGAVDRPQIDLQISTIIAIIYLSKTVQVER